MCTLIRIRPYAPGTNNSFNRAIVLRYFMARVLSLATSRTVNCCNPKSVKTPKRLMKAMARARVP